MYSIFGKIGGLIRHVCTFTYPIDKVIDIPVEVVCMGDESLVGVFYPALGVPGPLRHNLGVADVARSLIQIEVGKRRNTLSGTGMSHQFPMFIKLIPQIDARKNLPSVIGVIIDVCAGIK